MTITTLATCSAFLSGMLSSLQALQSFCLFATVTTAMLYFSNMTFFLAVVVWDTRRVQNLKKECFNLCCCSESSRFCCKGKLASHKQRDYTGNIKFRIADINSARSSFSERPTEVDTARREIQKNSHSERCCGMVLAPVLLHNVTRISLLLFYVVLIAGSCYSVLGIRVHFSQMYFVSERSSINAWFEANQKYFQEGGDQTITYVQDEAGIDFSEIEQ